MGASETNGFSDFLVNEVLRIITPLQNRLFLGPEAAEALAARVGEGVDGTT